MWITALLSNNMATPTKPIPASPPPVKPPQPTQQQPQPVTPQTVVTQAPVPIKPVRKRRFSVHVSWLLVLFTLVVGAQIALLILVRNERNHYKTLKKEDADRVYLLQKTTAVSQDDIDELERAFLNEDEVIMFIQRLEKVRPLFSTFELRFTSDKAEGKDVLYLPFDLVITGQEQDVKMFLEKLLESTFAIEIKKFDMSRDQKTPSDVTLAVEGNIYIAGGKK